MNNLRATHTTFQRQRGAALLVMLVVLVLGSAAFLVFSLSSTAVKNKRDETTANALAQAKEALIGYAVTYTETHPASPQVNGYLPCPDRNGTGGVAGEGSSETCGTQNVSAIGRLPWRTLDLSPLRDSNGECLWYAVAGTYKNNPMTSMMNWDNNGLFQVLAASGVVITGQTMDSNAAAVIFAPDVPLNAQGQNRAPDGLAPLCGGNFTAGNYLDSDVAIGANNAAPSAVANAISQFFQSGATTNINDRIVFITKSDIFEAIKKRNDFGTFVSTLLTDAASCMSMSTYPNPVTIDFDTSIESNVTTSTGDLFIGRMPNAIFTGTGVCNANSYDAVRKWRDNLLYAVCDSPGTCLTVDATSCSGIVIFAGERNAFQTRISNADKNNWNNYLEDAPAAILTAFTSGADIFPASPLYDTTSPSTDIFVCIP